MVTLQANEISNIIRERIEQYNRDTGIVLQVGDGIARIYDLDDFLPVSQIKLEIHALHDLSTITQTSIPKVTSTVPYTICG